MRRLINRRNWIIPVLITIILISDIEKKVYRLPQDPIKKYFYLTPEQISELTRQKKINFKSNRRHAYDQPHRFIEFQKAIRTREGEKYPAYKQGYQVKELDQAIRNNSLYKARTASYNFVERGPANVPGRTRALIIMPGDPEFNTWIAGSVGGGLWKTTDAGNSWVNLTPDLPNLSVVSLAMSASDPSVIYAGTGESFGAGGLIEISGQGIFKSTDGGTTWNSLPSTTEIFNFMSVNRIIVDPLDPDILLISANQNIGRGLSFKSGIFKSEDGGESWRQVYQPTGWIQQIIADPGNFDIQYAAVFNNGVAKSEDRGETWRLISSGLFPSGRIELAVSPNNSNILYAAAEGELSGVDSDLYISEDGGKTWNLLVEENDGTNRNFFAATDNSVAQGSWNNTLAVHPFYDSIVFVGGVDLWRMQVVSGEITGDRGFIGVTEEGTEDFMEFVNFNSGSYWGNRLAVGDIDDSLFVNVEIRFGSGRSQMAHRFLTPQDGGTDGDGGAGIPDEEYEYEDYVEVPFEVWDMDNARQLMVSFRDQGRNGVWDLLYQNTTGNYDIQSREYFFIHAIPYDENSPANELQVNGGQTIQQMYFLWPYLKEGETFDPGSLPESSLVIQWGELIKKQRRTIRMTSWIGDEEENERILDYVHADQHGIYPIVIKDLTKEFKIIVSNDGGVYQSLTGTDPGLGDDSWLFGGMGYNTSQFYGVDKKPGALQFIGGLQDNGTFLSSPRESATARSEYTEVGGGDGMETVWNYGNQNELILSVYNNQFSKSVDGGKTWYDATSGLSDIGDSAPFISKLGNSKSNPEVLYALGASGVWKSNDFGGQWTLTEIDSFWPLSTTMDVEVSLADHEIVWAGSGMTEDERIFVSTNSGNDFLPVNNYDETVLGQVTGIATHPVHDSTAYLLFSFAGAPKILRTRDLGQSWEDISGYGTGSESVNGFPDVVVHTLLVMPHNTDIIWAGTEIGIFESVDNGESWHVLNDFPAVSVWDMKQVDNEIVIGTHGRGIWTVNIAELPEIPVTPLITELGIDLKGRISVKSSLRSSYDSTRVLLDGTRIGEIGATDKSELIIYITHDQEGIASVQLESFLRGKKLRSNSKSIELFVPFDVVEKYVNEFDDPDTFDDFTGNGFSIRTSSGFETGNFAIHSEHDYKQDTQYVFLLRNPVKISESESFLYYDDIAIVEPGESGSSFGDLDFWDYVVVEGSRDGVQWTPVSRGYDARYDGRWLNAYNNNRDGSSDLFVDHAINLHDTFNPGDTVFFRFRLFSDAFEVGWGWVIDNLYIQEPKPVGFEDVPSVFRQITTYPNPFHDRLTIRFSTLESGNTEIELLDINGRIILSRSLGNLNPGSHSFDLNAAGFRQGLYFLRLRSNRETQLIKVIKN